MDINGVLFSKNGETLILYPSKRQDIEYIVFDGVTTILPQAFQICAFQQITLPDSLLELTSDIFSDCTNLKSICGAAGSYAEAFAAEYGYNFIIKE